MAKKDDTVEQAVTFNRKNLVAAGWIAGGVLAFGATFAAGAALGHVADGPRGNSEYNDGQIENGPGDNDSDRPDRGMGGMMAPPAPTAPNTGSITPAPMTTP